MKKALALLFVVIAFLSVSFVFGQAPFQPAVPGAVTNYLNQYFAPVVQSGTFALTSGTAYVSGTAVSAGDVIIYTPLTTATSSCFTTALQSGTGFSVGSPQQTGTFSYAVFLP